MNISIGDYRVDNVNWFKEHEGLDAFQCDIIYCDKKIGFFSENYMAGPDEYKFDNDYKEEIEKLRETAKAFFERYSKEENNLVCEDMFIRFLCSLSEASKEATEKQKIVIETSFPYNYELEDNEKVLAPAFLKGEEFDKLVIPVFPLSINIDVIDREDEYEF